MSSIETQNYEFQLSKIQEGHGYLTIALEKTPDDRMLLDLKANLLELIEKTRSFNKNQAAAKKPEANHHAKPKPSKPRRKFEVGETLMCLYDDGNKYEVIALSNWRRSLLA
jgi:hypothetical protein